MSEETFNQARIGSQLEAIKNTGGTPEERAWAREFSGVLRSSPEVSLADAEHMAYMRVIKKQFEQK